MKQINAFVISVLCLLTVATFVPAAPGAENLEAIFENPPESARPWVFWYWMRGAVSREGITADLEAMKQNGLGGAYLMPIQDVVTPSAFEPTARQLSPEWWQLVKFAMSEADRLELKLAMHVCDGFATAGGPWITPELSMQKIVWSQVEIKTDQSIDVILPQPKANEGYYRDVAVLAFPARADEGVCTRTIVPKVTTDVAGAEAQLLVVAGNAKRLRSEQPCWIQYEFPGPFTCRSILVRPDGNNYQALRFKVEASDDGKTFRSFGRLEAPRHGWQDRDADYTFTIPAATARFFRFVYDPSGSEEPAEDLDSAKWKAVFKVLNIELFSAPSIPNYEGKSGVVWRRSSRATAQQLPDDTCVPLERIVNVTAQMDREGRLRWTPPAAGNWTILRVGHTSTGHRNETAGGGKGLECDKFNAEAVRIQFNGWFAEIFRQVGPELAARVLKLFHVDSWEAGSQNWSPVFLEEFKRRRGYDPTLYLPTFAGIPVGGVDISERFLFDVRQTITDLTNDVFFKTMADLAREKGCIFSAESTAPTMLGDGMRHFGNVDVPMGEFWLRSPTHDKPNDIHDAISGAHVYGKNIVQAEAFTELRLQWDEHPGMLKALGDHNFCLGINRLVLHVFMHNPWMNRTPGMTLGGVGLFFQRDQTWWKPARAWVDYLRRCQALLQQGTPVADVVYFIGEELPARAVLPERCKPTLPEGYAADSINRDALLNLAAVKNGRIVLPGGASYAVLVLADEQAMTPALAQKIHDLVKAGATVVGGRPDRSSSLEHYPVSDAKVRSVVGKAWADKNDALSTVLERLAVKPDVIVVEGRVPAAGIEWTHRALAKGDVYFVSNQRDEARAIAVSLRVNEGQPELWDPLTGDQRPVMFKKENGRTLLELRLAPHSSVFVVIRKTASGNVSARMETEHEGLRLEGSWSVQFGAKSQPVVLDRLESWTARADEAQKYYSGTAIYTKDFEWNAAASSGHVWLDLGDVANIAAVKVNGAECGVAWTRPYRVDISKALRRGSNRIEVEVTNTWLNRLLGDKAKPEAERSTFTTAPWQNEKAVLLPAGLLGPVRMIISN